MITKAESQNKMKLQCLTIVFLLELVSCHKWKWGPCPYVPAKHGFSMDQFLGKWYVLDKFKTSSTCLTATYSEERDGSLKVVERRRPNGLGRVGFSYWYPGTLQVPDLEDPAHMVVKFKLSALGNSDYIVVDTDYDGYALIYSCQEGQIPFWRRKFHRESAAFMQRDWEVHDDHNYSRFRQDLQRWGVAVDSFDRISHEDCAH